MAKKGQESAYISLCLYCICAHIDMQTWPCVVTPQRLILSGKIPVMS